MRLKTTLIAATALALLAAATWAHKIDEYKSGIVWPEPPVIDAGGPGRAPSDAVVLFDGRDMSAWQGGDQWKIGDGWVETAGGGVQTKQSFGDCQLHIEFATPEKVEGAGQGRGNSGVYLMGMYEVQILDSFENTTYFDGQCGAVYKQQPPTVNASRKPGEWQTYDIIFEAPRFGAEGQVERPGFVTVLHNGIVVHNHFQLQGNTSYIAPPAYQKHAEKLPLHLQFHGNPVRFRNIWIRESIRPIIGTKPDGTPTSA